MDWSQADNKPLSAPMVARARPAVPLGLWSIMSSLRGNLYVPRLHKFMKWFAIMMSPTAIKLVLSCLWYRHASVSTNMFSDCINLIALKAINLRLMHLKRNRAESLGCHDRHPLPRICLREPGSRDVINCQWRDVIHAQSICYRSNRYLHDVPSVCL